MLSKGTIVDIVGAHAQRQPEKRAFAFLGISTSGFGIVRELSYGELDASARRVGAALRCAYGPAARVLVACPSGPDFVISFLGALYGGLHPVPAPVPSEGREQHVRRQGIVASAGISAVLTDSQNLDMARSLFTGSTASLPCVTPDELSEGAAGELPLPRPDDLAFLQYTSGSTSEPRGVMVSHANVRANLGLIRRAYGLSDGTRVGGWLPPYHDMGLIGTVLLPLFLGSEGFLMTPAAFLRRPKLWLEMIGTHGITMSPAPNFAYDMCVRRIPAEQVARLDLSGWQWAVNGSEPVHASTVRDFSRHFAPAGLRPGTLCPSYGMAEATLFVSGGRNPSGPVLHEVDGDALERHRLAPVRASGERRVLVSSGVLPQPPDSGGGDGFDLRVVDQESHEELADGTVGEIWLRGPGVAHGYWGLEEETDRVFRARTADGDGPFLRTGDLGVRHEGRLYVTGRIKEVLILNGRNIYPQDIERVVREQHPACANGAGAAFTVPVGAKDERIVLVQEIRAHGMDGTALRELAHGVMTGLSAEFGMAMGNVVFVRPGGVLRSTSGKVRRVAMRDLFADGSLAPVFEEVDEGVRERFRPNGGVPDANPDGRPTTKELLK